ncbi:hypothetical protein JI435_309510 [Parastagonospora nodorum SN15]|uniref:Acyl-CoA dehydrogenase/oxidase N-terminal domain-containing protein n=1 Tax=Phaeosphaeria nodorum (strain SN15 / ATCC MYA-4574 / FGSC 10173) TaxID=321614 RepID=A0A7U2I0Z0_PHANO|nr:hypothetical protein JI435_309510 [Parastagonospora nodorum SN15]
MVDFDLSPEQKQLRANAKAFAQTVLSTAPKLYSALPTQNERFRSTLPIYQDAVRSGLIKGQIPISLGGTSNGLLDAAIVVEEFHAVEPSTAITILGTGLGLTPLILAGSKAQHEKFLSPFLKQEGEMLASFMHSEPGGTANWLEKGAPGLQTTAYREGDEWIVNGEKLWTTNSGGWDSHGADLACLVCREVPTTPSPQDPDIDPSSKILILLLTRADIATNPHPHTPSSPPRPIRPQIHKRPPHILHLLPPAARQPPRPARRRRTRRRAHIRHQRRARRRHERRRHAARVHTRTGVLHARDERWELADYLASGCVRPLGGRQVQHRRSARTGLESHGCAGKSRRSDILGQQTGTRVRGQGVV